jgi:nucleoside-diphosphate-sugar epimerase
VTDSGQVFNALSMHFDFGGYETGKGPAKIDAVVHFAAVPRVLLQPDNVTFSANVVSTYNVIEAAVKLGIRKIIIASSETTYGVCFAEGDKDYHHFPLEEDYDSDPMDSYGLSKVLNEKTARAFAMRYGADIYALRIGNVIEPHEYDRFPAFIADPKSRKRNAWSYIDARDLGQIVHLCLEKVGLGYQVFNAVNDTITVREDTAGFLKRWCPNTPHRRALDGQEAPLSNRKIREQLGFVEEHNWRKYVK